mgnify:FL=1
MKDVVIRKAGVVAGLLCVAGLALWPRDEPPQSSRARSAAPTLAEPRGQGVEPHGTSAALPDPTRSATDRDRRSTDVLLAGLAEAEKLKAALEDKWPPFTAPAPVSLTEAKRRPAANPPRLRRADASAMEQRFRAMPADTGWLRAGKRAVATERSRLGLNGIQLESAECRRDACRFELLLTGARAETRRTRLGGQSRTLATEKSVVHTMFEPSGAVRTVVYLGRTGPLNLG